MSVELRNPHSILETLRLRPEAIKQLVLPRGKKGGMAWDSIESLAKSQGIAMNAKPNREACAIIQPKEPLPLEDVLMNAEEKESSKRPRVWLALDCVQDVHNLGALFRTASFFNVRGILITQERTAPLSSTVYDIASGGVETVPFSIVKNLKNAIEVAKKMDLWVLGTSEHRG